MGNKWENEHNKMLCFNFLFTYFFRYSYHYKPVVYMRYLICYITQVYGNVGLPLRFIQNIIERTVQKEKKKKEIAKG